MKPYYQDNHIRIFNKDCRSMDELPDESVQCVVTSPPYWGLRKYSGEQELIWGGDDHCEHQWIKKTYFLSDKWCYAEKNIQHKGKMTEEQFIQAAQAKRPIASICSLCGAWKGQLGLEPMPELYIGHCIEILREIGRVLRKDGVVFWNIGDTYASGKGSCFNPGGGENSLGKTRKAVGAHPLHRGNVSDLKISGLKPKDLCLIPFRIAIAAQEDGWWVRSIIIWSKPNPMPESVKDRPTKSHEYVLMLTKSAKYYWDQEAVREKQTGTAHSRGMGKGDQAYQEAWGSYYGFRSLIADLPSGRNIRTIWEFPTVPFPGIRINGRKVSPFAVFPEKLPELCIKAATPEVGCCSKCGAPWARITEKQPISRSQLPKDHKQYRKGSKGLYSSDQAQPYYSIETLGWKPTCTCNAPRVPSLILDPLMGAGTTLLVAKKLNRYAAGYEISQEYCQLAVERCWQQVLV